MSGTRKKEMRMLKQSKIKSGAIKAFCCIAAALFAFSGCAERRQEAAPETPSPSAVFSAAPVEKFAAPLIFEKEGYIYLASGEKTVTLGGVGDLYTYCLDFNMTLSDDNGFLFYIVYKGNENAGDLMRVRSDALSAPEKIAEGVCAARPNADGSKVLYITDIANMSGTLFLKDSDSEPYRIAQNVLPVSFGFSPGGNCIYYFAQRKDGAALYIKKGADEAAQVMRIDTAPKIDRGVKLDFDFLEAGDDGRILYTRYNADTNDRAAYLFNSDGTTETISEHCSMIITFGSPGELLFATGAGADRTLWYKAPGKRAAAVMRGDFDVISGGGETAREQDAPVTVAGRQVFILGRDGKGGGETLYLFIPGNEKAEIAKADKFGEILPGPGGCAVYQKGGGTYVSRETAAGRKEEKLSDGMLSGSDISFDDAGGAVYYIEYGGSADAGDLYKYLIKSGAKERLTEGAVGFELIGDTPYAFMEDGWVCMINGQNAARLAYNYIGITRADGGAYLTDDQGNVLFAALDGSIKTVARADAVDDTRRSIKYYPPMAQDPAAVLDSLANDALYYLGRLDPALDNGYPKPLRSLDQDMDVCGKLSLFASGDDAKQAFSLFSEAFEDYALWERENNNADAHDGALSGMQRALGYYNAKFSRRG